MRIDNEDTTPLFSLQIAAEKTDTHPTRLIAYDRLGFVRPARENGHRRYSYDDIRRVKILKFIIHDMKISIDALQHLTDAIHAMRDKKVKMPTAELEFLNMFIK